MSKVDGYIEKVVDRGDEGSDLLAKICAPTLRNCEYVDIISEGMHGIAVLRVPKGKKVMVHSAAGDHELTDHVEHAESLVDILVQQADAVDAHPIAFADVIDASIGDIETVTSLGNALKNRADYHNLAIMNGELAILGERVNCPANVSGTMISLVDEGSNVFNNDTFTNYNPVYFEGIVFDPEDKAVYINSDGIGTKTEFYERSGDVAAGGGDFAAMCLDDTIKLGARARALSGVGEHNMNTQEQRDAINEMERKLVNALQRSGVHVNITEEFLGDRLSGYKEGAPAFNVSGSVVSTIDEKFLKNPLIPRAGDCLIAVTGEPNPRSNGITDKRKLMVELMGQDWHKTRMGKPFLEYLATPSTMLYPVFRGLVDKHLVSSVYHMSGGAFKGKLAKPLAKHGLYVDIDGIDLFRPDWRELAIQEYSATSPENSFAKWPMGNDGFVATSAPEQAIEYIESQELQARVVGRLEKRSGITGVRLVGIKSSEGNDIYFSGK